MFDGYILVSLSLQHNGINHLNITDDTEIYYISDIPFEYQFAHTLYVQTDIHMVNRTTKKTRIYQQGTSHTQIKPRVFYILHISSWLTPLLCTRQVTSSKLDRRIIHHDTFVAVIFPLKQTL